MLERWRDIELITFDLDDTLVATTATIPQRGANAVSRAASLLGRKLGPSDVEAVGRNLLGCDPDRRWDVLLESLGIDRNHPAAEPVIAAYGAPLLGLLRAVPGACDAVAALSERFKLTVVTNGEDGLQRAKLRHCGLGVLAAGAIVSQSFGVAKPDAAIFREACSRAGVVPTRALHVGDSPVNDVEGAIRAGMSAALIRTNVPHPPSPVAANAMIDAIGDLLELLGLPAVRSAMR